MNASAKTPSVIEEGESRMTIRGFMDGETTQLLPGIPAGVHVEKSESKASVVVSLYWACEHVPHIGNLCSLAADWNDDILETVLKINRLEPVFDDAALTKAVEASRTGLGRSRPHGAFTTYYESESEVVSGDVQTGGLQRHEVDALSEFLDSFEWLISRSTRIQANGGSCTLSVISGWVHAKLSNFDRNRIVIELEYGVPDYDLANCEYECELWELPRSVLCNGESSWDKALRATKKESTGKRLVWMETDPPLHGPRASTQHNAI